MTGSVCHARRTHVAFMARHAATPTAHMVVIVRVADPRWVRETPVATAPRVASASKVIGIVSWFGGRTMSVSGSAVKIARDVQSRPRIAPIRSRAVVIGLNR